VNPLISGTEIRPRPKKQVLKICNFFNSTVPNLLQKLRKRTKFVEVYHEIRSNNARIGAGATAKESPITLPKNRLSNGVPWLGKRVFTSPPAIGRRTALWIRPRIGLRIVRQPTSSSAPPADRAANVLAALMKNHGGNQKKEVDFVRSLNIYIKL